MTKNKGPRTLRVVRNRDYPIHRQIRQVAAAIKIVCPQIFKKDEPYPIVRMVKFKEGEIIYEISQGLSRAKTGPV